MEDNLAFETTTLDMTYLNIICNYFTLRKFLQPLKLMKKANGFQTN